MRLKLPDNFGGLAIGGTTVKLKADKHGCVNVEHDVALALLSHGAQPAPADSGPANSDGGQDPQDQSSEGATGKK